MTGNRSLDEFVGAAAAEGAAAGEPDTAAASDAAEPEAAPAGRESEPAAAADDPLDADAVEPMAETVAWSPDGGECARCGERSEERWRDGDELVCGGCKAW